MLFYTILTTLLVILDQWTKYLTVQHLELYESKTFIPKLISFTHVRNSGAAWSILENQMWFFYVVTVIVIVVILYYLFTEGISDKIFGTILSVILAGTIGNFIDRIVNQYVIDMIKVEFINFPVFNVADTLLVIGIGLLLIYTFYLEKKN